MQKTGTVKRNPEWLIQPKTEEELLQLASGRMWRLHNLYYIIDEHAKKVLFRPRDAQLDFLLNRHGFDIILKARQLGFSTVIQIDMLDRCFFNKNTSAAVVSQSLVDCQEIFRTKIKTAYDNLPQILKTEIYPISDSKVTLELSNGSIIRVSTSLRSSTNQVLHISEYGKICAKFPEKADEIRTGALNTVHAGQIVTIESTAEGREGHFYNLCKRAEAKEQQGKDLGPLDFKFHFYPWWQDPKYSIDPHGVIISSNMKSYFYKLEAERSITLTDGQKAWYIKKEETQQDDMKREFPATAKEAFEQSVEGAYFSRQMADARKQGRIANIPFEPNIPVNTFWDLGVSKSDYMAIWFHQRVGLENRFIHYYENSGEHMPHYAKYIQNLDFIQGAHYFPHDSKNKDARAPGSVLDDAHLLLKGEIYYIPRIQNKKDAINAARNILHSCWIDEGQCDQGIIHMDNYRKEWNDHLGAWRDTPRHDNASHCADAFMTFATGYDVRNDSDRAEEYDDRDEYDAVERDSVTGY